MADTKITALTSISTSTDPANDVFPIVDISDTTMAATGTTKKVTTNQLLGAGGTASLGTLTVTGTSTLTGAATVQGLTLGKGGGAIASNAAFGNNVLPVNTTGLSLVAIGANAMAAMQSGSANVAVGSGALTASVAGIGMTAIGSIALYENISGNSCTAVGSNAAYQATGSYTTAVGFQSLTSLVAGDSNTAFGHTAGSAQLSGSNNGFFGNGANDDSNNASNSYNYGNVNVASHKFRAGDVVVGTGNVVMSTAAKGIDFSATAGAGTMTSELLNDYEEGTWTPTFGVHVNLTAVVSVSAQYTKVGRLVTVSGYATATVTLPVTSTYFVLQSLPFANGTGTTGALMENISNKLGALQIYSGSIFGYFPEGLAIGAASFYYNITYSV